MCFPKVGNGQVAVPRAGGNELPLYTPRENQVAAGRGQIQHGAPSFEPMLPAETCLPLCLVLARIRAGFPWREATRQAAIRIVSHGID